MNPTKLCRIATEDGEYAIEVGADNGLWVRGKRRGSKWSGWGDNVLTVMLAATGDTEAGTKAAHELAARCQSHPDFNLIEVVPPSCRAEFEWCICADPENCTEMIPGKLCKRVHGEPA